LRHAPNQKLGGPAGLFRFDGLRFEKVDPFAPDSVHSSGVSVLTALPNGDLWITYLTEGASRLREGRFRYFGEADGLPAKRWRPNIELDGDGRLWASDEALLYLDGEHWRQAGPEWGLPPLQDYAMIADTAGALWLRNDHDLYRKLRGATRFEHMDDVLPVDSNMQLDSRGSLLLRSVDGTVQLRPAPPGLSGVRPLVSVSDTTIFDHDGNRWSVGCAGGLCRMRDAVISKQRPRLLRSDYRDVYTATQGLSSDSVMTLLEDRDGNLWASTKRGIDRFRDTDLVSVALPDDPVYFSVLAQPDGSVRIGTDTRSNRPDSYWQLGDRQPRELPGFTPPITCQYRAPDGTLWIGGRNGLWKTTPLATQEIARPRIDVDDIAVQAMVVDEAGDLWMSLAARGLFRLHDGEWTANGGRHDLPASAPTVAARAPDDSIWFGYADNSVYQLQGDRLRRYAQADGLAAGAVSAMHFGSITLVAGDLGLFRLEGARFERVRAEAAAELSGITGIVETAEGDLWLNSSAGVVHVAAEQARRLAAGNAMPADALLDYELFDSDNGLPGTAQQVRPLPTATLGSDGRIWFAATEGLAWLAPQRIHRRPIAPTPIIRGLQANGRSWSLDRSQALQLPPLTSDIEIDYTAPSMSLPQRLRFRYRLQGVDRGWRDAGNRRVAFYTNLRPGLYRFEVRAANQDGVWAEQASVIDFELLPAFYQTWWFMALCVLAVLALAALLLRLRMLQMAMRLRLRLDERHAERERIARDLHDTLLQAVQGLILRFHSVSNLLAQDHPAQQAMHGALDRAEAVLIEGRDRVQGLRQNFEDNGGFENALRCIGEERAAELGIGFAYRLDGVASKLDALIAEELYWIGREALSNAFQHAAARNVELAIAYSGGGSRGRLRMSVSDDGRGIDAAILDCGGRAGHFGLRGMRERAERIHAVLDISSAAGSGTQLIVDLKIPRR
jgi:signal transduction histidine kinase/ligand-binding sensor domain-containing protein